MYVKRQCTDVLCNCIWKRGLNTRNEIHVLYCKYKKQNTVLCHSSYLEIKG